MPSELREFIYLDDISVNSHLSSLGRALPETIVEQESDETETEGDLSAKVPMVDIGAGGRRAWIDSQSIETQMTVTAPYRFEDLLEALNEHGIEIYTNPDVRACQRGDVVRIEGEIRPMSTYRIEVAIRAFRNLLSDDLIDAMSAVPGAEVPNPEGEFDWGSLDHMATMLEGFTGEDIPLRIDSDEDSFGTTLRRENMRIDHEQAFIEKTEYTLIGRVLTRIPKNGAWDPVEATSLMDTYMDDTEDVDEFRDGLLEVAEEMNITMPEELIKIEGRTAIVYPIAMFW